MRKIILMCLGLLWFSAMLYAGGESEPTQEPDAAQGRSAAATSPAPPDPSGEPPLPSETPQEEPPPVQEQSPSSSPRPGGNPQLQLVILPFTGTSQADGENIALLLSNDRNMREAFTILVPKAGNLSTLANQQDASGITDTDTIAAIGRHFNADFVVSGHVKKLGDRNLVLMTIVKVATFQQMAGGYREFHKVEDIRGLLPDMTKKILEVIRLDTSKMPTLAVLPFDIPKTGVSEQDAKVLVQLLTIEIANSGKYAVLPRTKTIETALSMVDTLRSKLPDPNTIKAIGKAINAQCVLTGNVMRLGDTLNLFLAQIINIETASLRTGGEVEYRAITDGFQLIPDLAFQLTGVSSIAIPENMVWIPGGTFQMGNTRGDADEQPVHTVQVSSFFLGKTPVTQKDYEAVMGKNPSAARGPQLPVENVTWYDAVEYCNKLSVKEGLIPAYRGSNDNITCNFTANGYRLPTEAEWEYAARGGNRDTLTFDYAGGNSIDILGWYKGNSEGKSHEVGRKQANSLGLYDMAGNVWEWCWDWYWPYQGEKQQDPSGPSTGKERITRGGSWNSQNQKLRSTYRSRGEPDKAYSDLGFRVLRPIF